MPKVLSIREETSEEKKLREWFETQALESQNMEEAAQLLIGLVTGLLGALFGVLTVSAETLHVYLSFPAVKWCGILAVVLWLSSLLCALVVVMPHKWQSDAGKPETQNQVFKTMLIHKSRWLRVSVILFGGAVVALGVVRRICGGGGRGNKTRMKDEGEMMNESSIRIPLFDLGF